MGYHWKNETILSTSISLEFYLHNWKSSPGYTVPTLLARRMEQLRSPMWTWTSWMDKLHVLKLWMARQWREPVRPSRYITLLKKTSSLYFRGYKRLSFVTHDVPLATLWSTKWKIMLFCEANRAGATFTKHVDSVLAKSTKLRSLVADLLKNYGSDATAMKFLSWTNLYAQ